MTYTANKNRLKSVALDLTIEGNTSLLKTAYNNIKTGRHQLGVVLFRIASLFGHLERRQLLYQIQGLQRNVDDLEQQVEDVLRIVAIFVRIVGNL